MSEPFTREYEYEDTWKRVTRKVNSAVRRPSPSAAALCGYDNPTHIELAD